jgi:hypothetical protein
MSRPIYLQGKSPCYPLDRRLGGPQSRYGRGGEEKNFQPLPRLEPPIIQPVAQRNTTELSRLLNTYIRTTNVGHDGLAVGKQGETLIAYTVHLRGQVIKKTLGKSMNFSKILGCTQRFPDWPPGARLQMVQLFATRCSCIAILWVSLLSFAAITLYVASQRVIPKVSVYLFIDSIRKLLDTPSYVLRMELDQNLVEWQTWVYVGDATTALLSTPPCLGSQER